MARHESRWFDIHVLCKSNLIPTPLLAALGQPGTHPPPAYLSTSFHDGHHDMPGGPHRPGAATLDVCRRPNDAWMGPGSPGAMDLAEWDPGLGAGDGWGEAAVSLGEVMLGDREGGEWLGVGGGAKERSGLGNEER